eukprot:1555641-Pleurochrysis_carterae.AAC.1
MMASYDTGMSSRAAAYAVWAFLICGYAVYAVALKKSHVSSICCTLVRVRNSECSCLTMKAFHRN